jgi:hypothetical protein
MLLFPLPSIRADKSRFSSGDTQLSYDVNTITPPREEGCAGQTGVLSDCMWRYSKDSEVYDGRQAVTLHVIVHVVLERNTCQPVPMSPTIPGYGRRDPLIARGVGAHPSRGSGLHPGA